MKLRKLTLALTVLLSATVFAGKDKIKFGKIPVEDVKMAVYEADSNAEAVFLHDEGQTYFIFEGSFFKMIYERHFRIKILSNEGLHWADIEIPYYVGSGGTEEEDVYQIKAVTHNYEDGEVVTEKFDKKDIYKEKASKYYKQIRFAMPKVKVGSVIEVTYTKKSDNFSLLSDWQFQYTIPVRHSEYTVKTPEYFIYKESMGGYLRYNRGTKSSSGKIGELHYSVDERHYSMDNIPAFNVEPMCSNPYNYVSQVSFELEYFNGTDFNYYKDFSSSWAEVIDDMLEAEGMGKEMQKNPGFIKDQANVIKLAAKSDVEKIQMAYEWVKSKIMWNGVNGDYKQYGINKAFKEGKGNTADVNFTLISLLRNCGFITHPVVLSTRKNGIIRPGQVTAMKFNYVICYVELGDNYLLLDATDKYCPLNILPKRCLNGKGRIVSATKNEWVDLKSHVPSKETKMYNIKLTADNTITGMVTEKFENYSAYSLRKKLINQESEEKHVNSLQDNSPGLSVSEFTTKNKGKLYLPLQCSYNINYKDYMAVVGDMIFLNPLLFERMNENLFKIEKREYPVDFVYPKSEKCVFNIQLPQGYTVEETPESVKFLLGENGGSFLYQIRTVGNMIQLICDLQLKKGLYSSFEYAELKNFFDNVVAKHAENIVLKKL